MKTNPVGWFEIYVQDMPRAKAFYEAVFDGTLEPLPGTEHEMWGFPMSKEQTGCPGCPGALIKMEGCTSGGGGTLIYFTSEDCAVEQGRVVAAGGQVSKEKFPIGDYGFISLVVDTEGNMIGLHSMK
ncbi:MAG: VOC family protein [Verrucomicrobiota bacterium]